MSQLENAFQYKVWETCSKNCESQEKIPKKNKIQVNLINSGLGDLKEEIEDMSEQEKETENPNEI